MPRAKKEAAEVLTEPAVKPSEELAPLPVKAIKRPLRKVSFEQWARARGIKEHHKGGLKAFVKNYQLPRSFEEWDKLFADY